MSAIARAEVESRVPHLVPVGKDQSSLPIPIRENLRIDALSPSGLDDISFESRKSALTAYARTIDLSSALKTVEATRRTSAEQNLMDIRLLIDGILNQNTKTPATQPAKPKVTSETLLAQGFASRVDSIIEETGGSAVIGHDVYHFKNGGPTVEIRRNYSYDLDNSHSIPVSENLIATLPTGNEQISFRGEMTVVNRPFEQRATYELPLDRTAVIFQMHKIISTVEAYAEHQALAA